MPVQIRRKEFKNPVIAGYELPAPLDSLRGTRFKTKGVDVVHPHIKMGGG